MAICTSCGTMNDDLSQTCSLCGQQFLSTNPAQGHSQQDPYNHSSGQTLGSQANAYPPPYESGQPASPYSGFQPAYHPSSAAVPNQSTTGHLPMIGMVMGIVVLCLAVIGLIPCLGWLNWFTITLGPITTITNLVAIILEQADSNKRSKAVIGLILALVAVVAGGIRLVLGGGCV